MTETIILVDENDNEIGTEEKIKAHEEGKLHRAFSIFLFNSRGRMLITRRAKTKYHCGGMWTNTCCSHPKPGESVEEAAHRRLREEMGIDCDMKELFSFIYKAEFDNGLSEHEFDHVLVGKFDGEPRPDPEEADDWRWVSVEELEKEIHDSEKYTPWFQIAFNKLSEKNISSILNGQ